MKEDATLTDLFQEFWRAKFYMAFTILLALLLAFITLVFLTPKYTATMIVAPADGYALGDYASSVEYDHVAALPFWRPKDQEGASTDFHRFIYTLRGAATAEILMKDEGFINTLNLGRGADNKITKAEELAVYMSAHLKVDPLGGTPLRRLSYHHPDPEFAAALLRKIHLVADQMIRRDRRRQSQSRIEYLENALGRTANPDHRKGITNLLMQQEHIQMLANLDEAYAAIIVEPSYSTPKPTWPNKPLFYGIAFFIGGVLGYMLWALRHMNHKK